MRTSKYTPKAKTQNRPSQQAKMTVKEAAAVLGVSEQFIRIGLQTGRLPIGYAVKMSSRWTYYIDPDKLKSRPPCGNMVKAAQEKGT